MKIRFIIQIFISGLLIVLSISCSTQKIATMMVSTPSLSYDKSQLKGLNKYQKDAVYLIETIRQAYPRLETKLSEQAFASESKQLLDDLSEVTSDKDFEVRLQTFIALLKDGHSYMNVNYSSPIGKYPIILFKEKNDWIIANIDQTMDGTFIGSKIVSINQIAMDTIRLRIRKYESGENEYQTDLLFSTHQREPFYWKALGINKSDDNKLDFTVSKGGEQRSFSLYPKQQAIPYSLSRKESLYPFTKKQNNGFYYRTDKDANYAYLQMNSCLDYLVIKKEIGSYISKLTRPLALAFLKKQMKDSQNFGSTLQTLFTEINEKKIDNLIVDLRYNTGGDERLGKQLLWYLQEEDTIKGFTFHVQVSDFFRQTVKLDYKKYNTLYKKKHGTDIPYREVNLNEEVFNESYFADIAEKGSGFVLDSAIPKFKGKVYVLIGNETFSAAQILATTIADNRLALTVGQPLSNKPTTQTAFSIFKLPNTKKIATLSYIYVERPDSSKNNENTLYPDIELSPTFQEIIDGKDPSFDYIINLLQ